MSETADQIGSYEREVLRLLNELGNTQRAQAEVLRGLDRRTKDLEEGFLEYRGHATNLYTGLGGRVVIVEKRLDAAEPQLSSLGATTATLAARVDAADERDAALSGRALNVIAGAVVVLALAGVAVASALVTLLFMRLL